MQLGAISEDMKHIGWSYVEFKNNYNTNEIIKPFEIFFINGRFPSDENLGPIAAGNIPAFIKTETPISPLRLYEKFRNTPAHDLVCTQFLAAFNIYVRGDRQLSKHAMTEFYHNLSMQALNKSDDTISLELEVIGEIVKTSINYYIKEF